MSSVSPAQRGRSAATRLDAGEHTVMLPEPTARVVGVRWSKALGIRRARRADVSAPLPAGGRPAVHFAAAPNASDDGRRSHRCTRARCGWCGPFTFSQKYLITIIHPPSPICRPERSVQRELSCAGCLASRPEWRTLSAVRAGRGFVTGGNRYPAGRRERRGARLTRREEGAYATRRPVRPLRSASFSCSCSATGQPESGR